MGNNIHRPSQFGKAQIEFDAGNYSKAILLLKEEMRFHPRQMDAFRLHLKSYFRLYELDKVEEVYSKFYEIQHNQEDMTTKTLMVKEMFWYDEGKARFYAKDLAVMVKKQLEKLNSLGLNNNNNNNLLVQNKQSFHQNNTSSQSVQNNNGNIPSNTNIMLNNSNIYNSTNMNNNLNVLNNNNNSNLFSSNGVQNPSKNEIPLPNNNNQQGNSQYTSDYAKENLVLSRAWCMYVDCNYEEAVSVILNELFLNQQKLLISQNIRYEATLLLILLYNKQRLFTSSMSLLNDSYIQQQVALSKDKEFEIGIYFSETLSLQGKTENSSEKYRICSELIPQNIYVLYRIFSLNLLTNNLKQSRLAIDRAIKLRPNDSLVFKMQGDQYAVMKDSKSAMKMYEKGITVNKNCFRCLEALGDVSASETQRITYYERCAKANPCYTDVMIKIGIYYIQLSDDFLEALRWFFKAVENKTQHKLIYFYIARSFYQNDQYQYVLRNLSVSLNLTYEKINDQLSLAVKVINKYSDFFTVEDITEFILAIRFKYFQYFNTLAENLENVMFAKMFLAYIPQTQAWLHYFALYKTVLSIVPMSQQQHDVSRKPLASPAKRNNTVALNPLPLQNQPSLAPSSDSQTSKTNIPLAHTYLSKHIFTPSNEQAAQTAQKYFFDLYK